MKKMNAAERVPFASLIVETSHEIYGEKMERELARDAGIKTLRAVSDDNPAA